MGRRCVSVKVKFSQAVVEHSLICTLVTLWCVAGADRAKVGDFGVIVAIVVPSDVWDAQLQDDVPKSGFNALIFGTEEQRVVLTDTLFDRKVVDDTSLG